MLCVGATLVGGPPASAGTLPVTAATPVGYDPYAVAIDSATHDVYTANLNDDGSGLGTVSVVAESGDARTGTVISTIPVGFFPAAVAVDSSTHQVYVANQDGDLSVIDGSGDARRDTVIATIHLGAFLTGPVAVDPGSHDVYVGVGTPNGGEMAVVDESGGARTGRVISTTPIQSVQGIAVDPTTHTVYVTGFFPDVVSVVDESGDARTGTVTARYPVGNEPGDVAVDPVTHDVYVVDGDVEHSAIYVLDESGDAEHGTIRPLSLGGWPQSALDVAVDPSTHEVHVSSPTLTGPLWLIDGAHGAAAARLTAAIPVVANGGITVDPSTHAVYVTDRDNSTVSALAPLADVALRLSGPRSVADGARFTETLTVADTGPAGAHGVVTNLPVPNGLGVVSAPGATRRARTLVWTDATVAAGTSVSHPVVLGVAADVHTTTAIGGVTIATTPYDRNQTDNAAVAVLRLG